MEIKFPILYDLSLYSNDIESIEQLSSIYMPTLKKLFLSKTKSIKDFNKISSIKVFKKVLWPSFIRLSIRNRHLTKDENKIVGGTELTQLDSKHITILKIELQE